MTNGLFSLRRPSSKELNQLRGAQSHLELTYESAGGTNGTPPAGYREKRWSAELGAGPEVFQKGKEGLRWWAPHRGAGMELAPAFPAIEEGTVLVGLARTLGIYVTTACRIVYVIDEPGRYGFGYGTLPHHPEQGEEAFVVRMDAESKVHFEVRSFSRPGHPLIKLGGPVGPLIQSQIARRYLAGMRSYVERGGPGG
jgi:uncharacterized protein (UPF0548 family)